MEVLAELLCELVDVEFSGPDAPVAAEAGVGQITGEFLVERGDLLSLARLEGFGDVIWRGTLPVAVAGVDRSGAENLAKRGTACGSGTKLHQSGAARVADGELPAGGLDPHKGFDLGESVRISLDGALDDRIPAVHHRLVAGGRGRRRWGFGFVGSPVGAPFEIFAADAPLRGDVVDEPAPVSPDDGVDDVPARRAVGEVRRTLEPAPGGSPVRNHRRLEDERNQYQRDDCGECAPDCRAHRRSVSGAGPEPSVGRIE